MKKAKTIISVIVIFLLGSVCGGLAVHIVYKAHITRYLSGEPVVYENIIVRTLGKKLNLDGDQREKIRVLVKEAQTEMQLVRKQYRPQMEGILEKSRLKIREVLRPDQAVKFDALIASQRAKAAKHY